MQMPEPKGGPKGTDETGPNADAHLRVFSGLYLSAAIV